MVNKRLYVCGGSEGVAGRESWSWGMRKSTPSDPLGWRRLSSERPCLCHTPCLAAHAMPCGARHAVRRTPCHAPCHAMPCHAMPCHAMPCHAMPCHAMPCHAMPCHAMPCHAMPCAMQCDALSKLCHASCHAAYTKRLPPFLLHPRRLMQRPSLP
eukprot:362385-Chlamydomonas_euryale.AAC.2